MPESCAGLLFSYELSLDVYLHACWSIGEVIAAVMGDTIPRYYVVGDAVQTVTDIHGTSKGL